VGVVQNSPHFLLTGLSESVQMFDFLGHHWTGGRAYQLAAERLLRDIIEAGLEALLKRVSCTLVVVAGSHQGARC